MDDFSDNTSYAGSVANGGQTSLDMEDTIRVQSHMRTQSTYSEEEDAGAIKILEESTEGRMSDGPANAVVDASSREINKVSIQHRALPQGSLNGRNQIEPETAFQQLDVASKRVIADAQAIQFLLDNGLDIRNGFDVDSSEVKEALCTAAALGYEAVVQLLLEKGAKMESKDRYSPTPLSLAAELGHEAVVKQLLEKGAKLESKSNNGRTPLSLAAEHGHEAVVKQLLEKGAKLESKSNNGRTPLSLAAEHGHEAVVKQLLEKGAEVESEDEYYRRTPLLWAATYGHEAVVKQLLEKGASGPSSSGSLRPPNNESITLPSR
jgi:ankyrin repeat protein